MWCVAPLLVDPNFLLLYVTANLFPNFNVNLRVIRFMNTDSRKQDFSRFFFSTGAYLKSFTYVGNETHQKQDGSNT